MAGVLKIPFMSKADEKPAAVAAEADKARYEGTLIARGITKSYRNRRVVNGVSLVVRRGEAVGLLGPNGAGKTTCFYMITGLVPVDQRQNRDRWRRRHRPADVPGGPASASATCRRKPRSFAD